MDTVQLAIMTGIAAIILAALTVYVIAKMLKDENILYLVPAIILVISEAGDIFLFALCLFSILNIG